MRTTIPESIDLTAMETKAAEVADILGVLANARRLQILCVLIEAGETNVGTLVNRVAISQSALSQHLAKMREEGVVRFRRESQTLWYSIADERIEALMAEIHRLFCRQA
jgi:ArsR family transcriptional regulator, virulence genes transcriptional regulator